MILPRKTRSLGLLIASLIFSLVCLIYFRDSYFFLIFIAFPWMTSNGKEFYKAIKYERAKQEYEDKKEQLEIAIDLLK